MFGMGAAELVVVIVVGLVVFGPKELPIVLQKLGQWAGRLRRMAADLRAQSGIDDALRAEGLDEPISELRRLAKVDLASVVARETSAPSREPIRVEPEIASHRARVPFDREYPIEGVDVCGARSELDEQEVPVADAAADPESQASTESTSP